MFKSKILSHLTIIGILTVLLMFLDKDNFEGIHEKGFTWKGAFERFYLACTTVSTVGYGDVYPKSVLARSLVSGVSMLVVFQYADFFSILYERQYS